MKPQNHKCLDPQVAGSEVQSYLNYRQRKVKKNFAMFSKMSHAW